MKAEEGLEAVPSRSTARRREGVVVFVGGQMAALSSTTILLMYPTRFFCRSCFLMIWCFRASDIIVSRIVSALSVCLRLNKRHPNSLSVVLSLRLSVCLYLILYMHGQT